MPTPMPGLTVAEEESNKKLIRACKTSDDRSRFAAGIKKLMTVNLGLASLLDHG